jgi:hypothetical protein
MRCKSSTPASVICAETKSLNPTIGPALAPHLPAALHDEALELAGELKNETDRAYPLTGLSPLLRADDLQRKALTAARKIDDPDLRVSVIAAVNVGRAARGERVPSTFGAAAGDHGRSTEDRAKQRSSDLDATLMADWLAVTGTPSVSTRADPAGRRLQAVPSAP